MGNSLSSAYNKFQYKLNKYISDPEADNFAKQQAAQAAHDKIVAEQKAKAELAAAKSDAEKEKARADSADLAIRSQFSTPQSLVKKAASEVMRIFKMIFLLALSLYGGKIMANEAIGYHIPFRILNFLCGMLLFFIVIPKSFIDRYYYKKTLPDYAWLPLAAYDFPEGWAISKIIQPFCYPTSMQGSVDAAAKEVMQKYKAGFDVANKDSAGAAAAFTAREEAVAAGKSEANINSAVNNAQKAAENSVVVVAPANAPANSTNAPSAPNINKNANAPPSDPVAIPNNAKPATPPASAPPPASATPASPKPPANAKPATPPASAPPASPKPPASAPPASPKPTGPKPV